MSRSAAGNGRAGRKPAPFGPAADHSHGRRDSRRRLFARLRRDERGAALTELALVLPVLLLLLLGMIDFGKAINYWIDETHLANEGARLAAVNSNPGSPGTLQQYLVSQTETREQRCPPTNPACRGTQRSSHSAAVAICFYRGSDGSLITSGSPLVGDTVEVLVRYDYQWLKGFPFPGAPSTQITGKAAMRLEAVPTKYSTAGNSGSCPASA